MKRLYPIPCVWQESVMINIRELSSGGDNTCMGSGLAVLDVIFRAGSDEPKFMAGGSCCNVLTILSYMGWKSFPVVRLGRDIEGDRIVEDITAWGVQDRFVERDPGMNTPRIIQRTYARKNPRHTFSPRCAHGKRLPYARPFRLSSLRQIEDRIPAAHVFYFDRATPSSLEIARRQKRLGALIVFEPPRLRDEKNFRACMEISDILKHCGDAEPEDYGCNRTPLEIQTRGGKGLRYRTAGMLPRTEWTYLEAFDVCGLVDAAGAGDWLTAGLIHALIRNNAWQNITIGALQDSLLFGQSLAALNCLCSGARGLMYRIPSNQLSTLVSEVISNGVARQALMGTDTSARHKPGLSSKCKICLCK